MPKRTQSDLFSQQIEINIWKTELLGGNAVVIKCKMCGGDIEFNLGDTFGQCSYCGCTSTLPKADDDQKLNRYNRANHFRRQGEFDKAISAYDKILEDDNTDAEAHWGIVLSRYGIEYVQDPVSGKRIPTCHRVQIESILADEDYLAAIEHASDERSKELYEEQAKEIAEIQREILAISQNETPYDIFICYKETDKNGKRTKDSALAQEVYYGLVEQGYKVFFSRITLEDKLGEEYEPYIFAALNSARVMVVIGTKPEYFNAVWVKNEWSRYLRLIKTDRKRLLIPCYRDMDPYDLPEELGNLQSQDMSRIGFIQDLQRGINKVLSSGQGKDNGNQSKATSYDENSKVDILLDRAFLSLEDGEYEVADDFCEQALNLDPRNSRAYLGKLMIERRVRTQEALTEETLPLEKSTAYQRALRFANESQKEQLETWNQTIIDNNEKVRKNRILDKALKDLEHATTIGQCKLIKNELVAIENFTGVREAIQSCDAKIEGINSEYYTLAKKKLDEKKYDQAREDFERLEDYRDSHTMAQEAMYQKATTLMNNGNFIAASDQFRNLGNYRDSGILVQTCLDKEDDRCKRRAAESAERRRIEEERKAKEAAERAKRAAEEEERKREAQIQEQKRLQQLQTQAKRKKIIIAICLLVVVLGAAAYLFVIKSLLKYNEAVSNMEKGQYSQALNAFDELSDYRDSKQRVLQVKANIYFDNEQYNLVGDIYSTLDEKYQDHASDFVRMYDEAKNMLDNGQYDEAIAAFTKLGKYSDSSTQILEAKYRMAADEVVHGNKENAISLYQELNQYRDSQNIITQLQADVLFEKGDYAKAWELYKTLEESYQTHRNDYADKYAEADALLNKGEYDKAKSKFSSLGAYSDSETRVTETTYIQAIAYAEKGEYDKAISLFDSIPDYKDTAFLSRKAAADKLFDAGNYADAWNIYVSLNDSYQSHAKDYAIKYADAEALLKERKFEEAKTAFTHLGTYSDSEMRVTETIYKQAIDSSEEGEYDKAINLFNSISEYEDAMILSKKASADKMYDAGNIAGAWDIYVILDDAYQTHANDYENLYNLAAQALIDRDFDEAYDTFSSLGNYKDAHAQAVESGKRKADLLYEKEQYNEAAEIYMFLGDNERANDSTYLFARQLMNNKQYELAAQEYDSILEYKDSKELRHQAILQAYEKAATGLKKDSENDEAKEEVYQIAINASEKQMYDISVPALTLLEGYKDSAMKLTMETYAWGEQLFNESQYDHAAEVFESMGDFSDASEKAKVAKYAAAEAALNSKDYDDAIIRFEALGNYKDSRTKIKEAKYTIGLNFLEVGDYTAAKKQFKDVGKSYNDSANLIKECDYRSAKALYDDKKYEEAYNAIKSANISQYSNCAEILNDCRYQIAVSLMSNNQYTEAIPWLEKAGTYLDSLDQLKACYNALGDDFESKGNFEDAYEQYVKAENTKKTSDSAYQAGLIKVSDGDYEGALAWFENSGDYEPAKEQIISIGEYYYSTKQYDLAIDAYIKAQGMGISYQRLYELGQYYELSGETEKAIKAYGSASSYKDAAEKYQTMRESLHEKNVAPFLKKGSSVSFGSYEQNNNKSNGKEKIRWTILDVQDNKCLLISIYGLDCMAYNTTRTSTAWSDSPVRRWLNSSFINDAFTNDEKDAILVTEVKNGVGQGPSGISGDINTQDKLFLLSCAEAKKYFGLSTKSNTKLKVSPTLYAQAKGAQKHSSLNTGWWFLRSRSNYKAYVCYVTAEGALDDTPVTDGGCMIRPAFWLDLESEYFYSER